MYYGTTTLATRFPPVNWRGRLVRSLLFFIPLANPDHEPLYPHVSRWLLEVDEDGHPFREIGLDETGKPLFGAPDKRNFGFFTDSDSKFSKADLQLVECAEFERHWHAVSGSQPRAGK